MQQFNKIKSWWHPSSEMNVLFQYNHKRIQFLRRVLKENTGNNKFNKLKPVQNMKILDVGCGAGFLSQSLSRLGALSVTGLDPNLTSFTQATTHQPLSQKNLQYFNCSIQQYLQKFPQQLYSKDLVTSMDVIQHVDNPLLFIKSLIQSLKPDGLIMLSTISKTFQSFFTHIIIAQYVTGLVPRGTHNYEKFLTPKELKKILEEAGVEVINVQELEYNWRGEFQQKNGGANYMIIGRKKIQKIQTQQTKIEMY